MSRPLRRMAWVLLLAIFAVLWPVNYGINAHSVWLRIGALLLLVFRAMFIGYGAALLLFRPMLTVRKPGEQPLISLPQAFRMLRRND